LAYRETIFAYSSAITARLVIDIVLAQPGVPDQFNGFVKAADLSRVVSL
jgi:hypothetical protein